MAHPGRAARHGRAAGRDAAREAGDARVAEAAVAFAVLFAALGDRLVLSLATGGRGALSLVIVAAPVAAALVAWRLGTGRTLAFLRSPVFLLGVAPYLAFVLVLPFLGVLLMRYEARTLLSATEASTAVSFLVLGAAASMLPLARWGRWVVVAIAVELVYAGGQVLYLGRGPGWEVFSPFHAWDLSYEALYGAFVQARATGLFFNPNELGLWAGMAAALAWLTLPSRRRIAAVLLAVGTLGLSQSRGASVALLAAAGVGVALAVAGRRLSAAGALRTGLSLAMAIGLAVLVVVAVQPSAGLLDRFGALVDVWTHGPRADANLAGRLDYWQAVVALNALHPWGTLGPPEVMLGSAVDSTWFRVFAQGSIPFVGALVLLLAAPFAVRRSAFGAALPMLSALFAVAGVTQTPLNYPMAALFWLVLGAALQASVAAAPVLARRPAVGAGMEVVHDAGHDPRRPPGAPSRRIAGRPNPGAGGAR